MRECPLPEEENQFIKPWKPRGETTLSACSGIEVFIKISTSSKDMSQQCRENQDILRKKEETLSPTDCPFIYFFSDCSFKGAKNVLILTRNKIILK